MLNDYVVKTLRRQSSATKRLLSKLLGRSETPAPATDAEKEAAARRAAINTKETYRLRYDDKGDGNFNFAECCHPIPGDPALGFIEDDGTVTVHALDCPRASVLKASFGPRILSTAWEVVEARFPATIHMEGIDRHGILHELISLISKQLTLDIRALDIRAEKEVFHADLSLLVGNVDEINALCAKIRKIPGVEKAARL